MTYSAMEPSDSFDQVDHAVVEVVSPDGNNVRKVTIIMTYDKYTYNC